MSQNVPRVGMAFQWSVILRKDGVMIEDPSTVYASGDVTAFFGGASTTEVTLAAARRGTTRLLDITVTVGQHVASPVHLIIKDRNGTLFDDDDVLIWTNPALQYTADTNYAYIKSGATVIAHAPLSKVGAETIIGVWVDGDVPPP